MGPQYRSVVFYHSDEQKKLAEHYKQELDQSGAFPAKIVTEITAAKEFYPAEKYHQKLFSQQSQPGVLPVRHSSQAGEVPPGVREIAAGVWGGPIALVTSASHQVSAPSIPR